MRRLLLVRHAATAATRAAAFPADEPLDERGREAASALADRLPFAASAPPADRGPRGAAALADRVSPLAAEVLARRGAAKPEGPRSRCEVLCSPTLRCMQPAAAAGLGSPRPEPLLAECDFGSWAGRSLADVPAADAGAWMTDPAAAPHGGESLRAFAARVAGWLDAQAHLDGRAVAITHGGVVKAAVVHALGAPLEAFWRIDVSPLSITELHAHDGRWTVAHVNSMSDSPRYSGSTRHAQAGEGVAAGEGASV